MSLLGNRLREARDRKGLSQIDVCKKIKINNKTLSRYEKGGTEPDIESLNLLSKLYEVSVDWLTGRTDKPNETVKDGELSEWRKKAIEEIYKMPEEEFNYFYELMKRLKK